MANSIFLSEERLPRFLESRSTEEKLAEMEDYLYLVSEQLRYMLQNLDERNFNAAGLTRIEAPLYARIGDAEGTLRTELELTAGTLRAEMSAALAGYETVAAAAGLLADAKLYTDGAVATLSQSVAANYLQNSARAGIVAEAAADAEAAVAQMVLYVEDGEGTSSISLDGGTIELNTNITEVNSTLHIGGAGNRYDGEIRLNRYCTLTADGNEDLEVYAGATLMLDAFNEVWIQPGDGSVRLYAGSAGRYWYFDGTGIYWCNANGSIRKSVVLE